MNYYLASDTDPTSVVYEKEGAYYPVFSEKYGTAAIPCDPDMRAVSNAKTCAALDLYMQPYEADKVRVYMAGPLFNEGDRYTNQLNSDALRRIGFTTFLPQEVVIDKDSDELIKAACFFMDLKAIRECDILLANCNGIDIDSGTAAEIGLAYGWNKKTIFYKSDVRNYYNETFRLNNFVGGLSDYPVCGSIADVIQVMQTIAV